MSKTGSFIHDLVEEVLPDVETPYSYIYWSLMTCISAAAVNKYYVTSFSGKYIYYPNIYVILLGESGLGKAFGITLAKKLFKNTNITRVIAGRSSIQFIVNDLATTTSANGKPLITDSRGFIINGELSTGLISDPDALTILTDLFDGKNDNPDWANSLKGEGKVQLKDPYITCLFGSSPSHFFEKVPQANIEGGYIGRNLIIWEEQRSKIIDPFSNEDSEQTDDAFAGYLAEKYTPHLVKIAERDKLKCILSDDAKKVYNPWRRQWKENQHEYNDRTGFINRVPDHVVKVAICLGLSRYDFDGIILLSDIQEAIDKITGLVYQSQKITEGTGLDPTTAQTKFVINCLLKVPENKMTRHKLLLDTYGNLDAMTLDRAIETLMEMKWVKRVKHGSDWMIMLSGEPLERLIRHRELKQKKVT